jgi:hypothetical protein
MANLIAPLCRAHRVGQFLYLICPNKTPDENFIGFKNFQIFETTHTSQTGFAYWPDRYEQISSNLNF